MVKDVSELPIQYTKGIGPQKAALLSRLGIRTVRDALYYFPARYEDRKNVRKIRDISPGGLQTVTGRVISADLVNLGRGGRLFGPARRGGMKLFELAVTDGTGVMKAKWFNQPFMKKRFRAGQEVVLSGAVKPGFRGVGVEMDNPEYEILADDTDALIHTARTVPVYRATENLSSRQLRGIMHKVIEAHLDGLADPVPAQVLRGLGFPGLAESVRNAHFPSEDLDPGLLNAWRTPFQRRLAFEELFLFQAGLALLRKDKELMRGISFSPTGALTERLLGSLPFSLTGAQRRAFGEILADMRSPLPMNRLLQGDVGSGKTVVALLAMLAAVECGYQAALMAPTEILAEQHYLNIHRMVEDLGLRIRLVTGSVRDRPLEEIASGEADVVVGTHAIIQESVRFARLGLAVIDEQHRFGVMQRSLLRKKAVNPDILVMTATPIPRTLALTLYGDLDCSVIGEMPPGRTPVRTEVIGAGDKARVYGLIEAEVNSGGQVYVVYPVIEESEKTNLKSAEVGEEALRKVFPAMRVGLIHGRMRPAEREAVMAEFKRGGLDVLVSTTVIEVGVDVPNASLMLIVHAERFGLSQLHQLRGRVGRGGRQSRCVLLAYEPLGEEARRRLSVMEATTDGFRVAEEDLDIRGPGEFLGTRQSGMPDLRVASIVRDADLLEPARREAFALVGGDPELKGHPELRAALLRFWSGRLELFKTA
ncbi:MAG: ATP-dependent DNA helicase RecG [Thermodesulfovibrionales bacterium]